MDMMIGLDPNIMCATNHRCDSLFEAMVPFNVKPWIFETHREIEREIKITPKFRRNNGNYVKCFMVWFFHISKKETSSEYDEGSHLQSFTAFHFWIEQKVQFFFFSLKFFFFSFNTEIKQYHWILINKCNFFRCKKAKGENAHAHVYRHHYHHFPE